MKEIRTIIAIVNKVLNKVERPEHRVTQFQRMCKIVIRLNRRAHTIIKQEQSLHILDQEELHKGQLDWNKVNRVQLNLDKEINRINLILEVWTRVQAEVATQIKNREA
jgi:hypothetical protein